MKSTETPMEALAVAVRRAGSGPALASRIEAAKSSPAMWKRRKNVPAEYCPAIERETCVACERLRPDVPWSVLREQPRPKD